MTPQPQHPRRFVEESGFRITQDMIDELRACVIQQNLKRFESDVKEIKRHPCASHSSAGAQQQRIEQAIWRLKQAKNFNRGNLWISVDCLLDEALALLQAGDQHEL